MTKSAIERMKEYAESWLDVGTEYSRGQIIEAMANKARELLREEQAQKPTAPASHPATKSDRCAELVKRLRERINKQMCGGSLPGDEWGPGSEFFYKTDVSNMLTDLRTILDEFSEDADGTKEGR